MAIILLLPLLLSSPTLADLASPVEAQPYGGTLKVALPSEPNTFNWFSAGSTWSINVLIPVYNRLFRWKNGTLMPELVKDWSVSDDGLTYTFTIHNNVTFQDGKQLTAEDVVFTINVEAQNDWPYYHGYFAKVDRAEVVDQFTFKIYMKEVDAGFLANALAVMNVLPKHIWEPLLNEKGEELAVYNPKLPDEVIGSGPFKLVEYVPGQYVKYTAYENYWQGRPYIDELIVTFITEATTAILAVKKGDIDLYEGWITPEVVPSLITTEGVGIHLYQSATFYHWGFNNLRWPFNITDFRRAMAYCVDKNEIVNTLLAGYGMPGSWGVVPPFGIHAYWYNPNVEGKYSFNLTKAGEILDSLGFVDVDGDGWREAPDGSDFSFEIYPPNYDIIRVRAAQMISDWLSKIPNGGIKAEVRVLEWKSVWPLIRDGKVDSYLLGSGPGADPTWLYRRFHSRPGGTGNWARYSNPEVDQLTEQIGKVLDKEQRREIAWRIQEILADEVPIIVLYYRKFPQPYRADKFDGWFKAVDDGLYNFWTFRYVHLKVETTQPTEPTQPTQPTEPTQPTPPPEEPEMGTNLQFMAALVVIVILIVIIVVLLVKKR
jgi:peptide/nickel transport system substrate-binding protein